MFVLADVSAGQIEAEIVLEVYQIQQINIETRCYDLTGNAISVTTPRLC